MSDRGRLPADIRTMYSGDALEVYRAAHNISYAYDGHDPFVAEYEAERAIGEVNVPLLHAPRDWIRAILIYVAICGVFWGLGGARPERLPLALLTAMAMLGVNAFVRWNDAKRHAQGWLQREAEMLDADGNPTMPGAVSPIESSQNPIEG